METNIFQLNFNFVNFGAAFDKIYRAYISNKFWGGKCNGYTTSIVIKSHLFKVESAFISVG